MDDHDRPGAGCSRRPFTHRIRVGWADCDPAHIAYTGRIPCFALEAIDAWWQAKTGIAWFAMNTERNLGTPFVHLGLDFRAPVTPRHPLDCEVRLTGLGASSVEHRVRGLQDGSLAFEGRFVSAFVVADTMTPRRAPADLRAAILPLVEAPQS